MPRRRRPPSKYRFLKPLGTTALAFGFLIFLNVAGSVACLLSAPSVIAPTPCVNPIPWFVFAACWLVAFGGCIGAGYRYYRDFICGDYYRDLDL